MTFDAALRTLLVTSALIGAAACSGPGQATTPTPRPTTETSLTAQPSTPARTPTVVPPTATPTLVPATPLPSASAASVVVELGSTPLGEVITDVDGRTLYGFLPDEEQGEPTCYESCAETWPPLLVGDDFQVGPGLSAALFLVVARTDGTSQLQVGDFPLYYFAGDDTPGQTNGQGAGGRWFVVGADGELVQTE